MFAGASKSLCANKYGHKPVFCLKNRRLEGQKKTETNQELILSCIFKPVGYRIESLKHLLISKYTCPKI